MVISKQADGSFGPRHFAATGAGLSLACLGLAMAAGATSGPEAGESEGIQLEETGTTCCKSNGECRQFRDTGTCDAWLDDQLNMDAEAAAANAALNGEEHGKDEGHRMPDGRPCLHGKWLESVPTATTVRVVSCRNLARANAPLPVDVDGPRQWVRCEAVTCGSGEEVELSWPVYSKTPLRALSDFEDAKADGVFMVKIEPSMDQLRVRGARQIEEEACAH